MIATSLIALSLVCGATPPMPEGHPPMGAPHGAVSPHGAGGLVAPDGLEVRVVEVSAAGARTPAAGVEVVLEGWTGRRDKELTHAWRAKTDAAGRAAFHDVEVLQGGFYVLSAVRDGVTFRSQRLERPASAAPVELRLYDRTTDRSDLTTTVFIGLEVVEKYVLVNITYTLANDSRRVIDLDGSGLDVALLLPAIGAEPWSGYLPPTSKRHMRLQTEPERGRLLLEGGRIVYRGPVMPGEGQKLSVRYAVPIVDGEQDLALRMPLEATEVMMVARWNQRVAPRIVPHDPYIVVEREDGESRQRQMRLNDEIAAGDTLLVHVDRLPWAVSAEGAVALGGTVLLLALFTLVLLGGRRRDD